MQNESYSKPIQGSKVQGYSHIYRNSDAFQKLVQSPYQGLVSLKQLFIDLFTNKYVNKKYLGRIKVSQSTDQKGNIVQKRQIDNILTYKQGHDIAQKLGSFLISQNLLAQNKQEDMQLFGIYLRNRQQFYLSDIASIFYGITSVPLYDTLGIQNLSFCLNHSQITTVICGQINAMTLLKLQDTGKLKNLILCDQISPENRQKLQKKFNLFYFWKIVKQFKSQNIITYKGRDVAPNKCFTFSYTSGTTGVPKAVKLTQKGFLSFMGGYKLSLKNCSRNKDDQVHISILPLPHCYQRAIISYQIMLGSFIVAPSGNMLKIAQEIALVKPTQIIAVPRLYNRIFQSFLQAFGGDEKLLDEIIEKLRSKMGGRIKFMLTGSAPINTKILYYMNRIMKCPFIEAYGQTQNTAGAFIQSLNDKDYGKVGKIWPNHEFKLKDIPSMGYSSNDYDQNGRLTPRGQILLRGNGVTPGYYKAEQLTKQTIDQEGWLHTGDVGMLTPETNTMKIIDRIKNFFKLSQGQFVSSEKVEFYYMRSKYVAEVFLHGEALENFAVCVIAVNKEQVVNLGKQLLIEKAYAQLCEDKQIIKHILMDLTDKGKQGKLASFQQAKNLRIEQQSFASRGIVSSTMKLQRFLAKKIYKDKINQMYVQGPLV